MATIQRDSHQVRFQKLLKEAASLQLSDLEQFIKQLTQLAEKKKAPNSSREKELIQKIKTGGSSEEFWKKYDVLANKLSEETMTEAEHQTYLQMTEVTMQWSVDRLKLADELSKIWEIPLKNVFQKLNIQPREPIHA